jgi:hypothetical protein
MSRSVQCTTHLATKADICTGASPPSRSFDGREIELDIAVR